MAYKVAQANPAAETPVDLYTVPAGKEAVCSTLAVCNFEDSQAVFDVLIRPGGASDAPEHRLTSQAIAGSRDTVFLTFGLALAAGDVVTVKASTGDCAFHLFFNEIDL